MSALVTRKKDDFEQYDLHDELELARLEYLNVLLRPNIILFAADKYVMTLSYLVKI